jgi:3-oxoadipate enol-lactonase
VIGVFERVPGSPGLAYEWAGQGQAVVMLHGIGGNRRNWSHQIAALSATHRALAWDARGYGDSDDYEGALDFTQFSDDLLRLLNHIGCERAHLCGLSMGGRIALDFHDRHPERVASLILADSFPGYDASFTQEGRERFVRERRQPLLDGKSFSDIAPTLAKTLVSPTAAPAVVEQLVESICRLHRESYLKTIEAMTMYQPVADLSRIKVPVQIIVGADDKLTPPSISQRMAAAIPHARLLVIANAGHLSNLEQPDAFNACAREFLASLS